MQKERRSIRYMIILLAMVIGSLLLLFANISFGSISIPMEEVLQIFMGKGMNDIYGRIIWDIRFPRAVSAFVLGGALALSGYLLQTFFHNPIAGPFVLGISSGSKLVVALVMVFSLGHSISVGSAGLILAAFIGALIAMGFVLLMSRKVNNMSMLVISGIMIGYICSAITDFIVTFAEDADIVNLHNWSRGSFSGMSWENVKVMTVLVQVTVVFIFLISKPIYAYQLGETYAKSMGVNITSLRGALIIFSSVLSACVVAYAGPISFVGIAVPHLVKILLGTGKPIWMIPTCFFGGSIFCLTCDLIARTAFAPTELSISTVTAIFGAPVVLWVMIRRRKENE